MTSIVLTNKILTIVTDIVAVINIFFPVTIVVILAMAITDSSNIVLLTMVNYS